MSLDTMYHHLWKHNVSDVSLLHRRWEPLSNKHVSFLRYFLAKEVRGFACFLSGSIATQSHAYFEPTLSNVSWTMISSTFRLFFGDVFLGWHFWIYI
jgi:hypothetical protein